MLAPRDRLWSTPAEVVARAVELLQITELDVVYDIGAGDGRFLFHCVDNCRMQRVIGVEISNERVQEIQKVVTSKSLSDRLSIILVPRGLRLILPLLKAIPHKVRVVTYMSPFPDSETPLQVVKVRTIQHVGAEWPLYLYLLN